MNESEELARLHDEEHRDEFALRRAERRMAAQERELEREMEVLEQDEERAERDIEDELRREHMGHDPERPPAWRKPTGDG